MVHTGHTLHQSVLNLPAPGGEQQLDTEQLQLDTEQLRALDHGNKLAVLGGDLLLAAACSRLAALRTPRVLELVSVAIAEMAQVTGPGQAGAEAGVCAGRVRGRGPGGGAVGGQGEAGQRQPPGRG